MSVTQSFAGIAASEALDTFDPRFTTLSGSFVGKSPSGGALVTGSGDCMAIFTDVAFAVSQYVQWVSVGTGSSGFIGGGLRLAVDGSGYAAIEDGATLYVVRYVAFSGSGLTSISAPTFGTLCRFEFGVGGVAADWRLLYDSIEVASGSDATYGTGAAGVAGFNPAGGLTNWEAGDLAAGGGFKARAYYDLIGH